jgi:hypothetical protein
MSTVYVAAAGSLAQKAAGYHLSANLGAVILFSLVGLAASAALITGMSSDTLSFFLGAF